MNNENGGVFDIRTNYAGQNYAFPLPNAVDKYVVPDLDVKSNFIVSKNRVSNTLDVLTMIKGDGFPNAEAYAGDPMGQRVFLGTHVRQGDPFHALPGDKSIPMITSSIKIQLDKNGNFSKVYDNTNRTSYSIKDWNIQWSTRDSNAGRRFGRN